MSQPQYIITYGQFSFPVKVLNASASTIYEEDRVTVTGTNYSFGIDSWVYGNDAADFATKVNAIRCQLQTPRLAFNVQWNTGAGWSVLYNFDSTMDIDYGPKTRDVNITRFSGGRAARVTFNLDVQVKECFGGSCGVLSRPNNVLAYTYAYAHSIDVDGLTRRTVSGKYVLTSTSGLAAPPLGPDAFRNKVVPGLPQGFQRITQDFTTSVDGRTLSYSIVDQEVNNTLPTPATSGDASFTASQTNMGGTTIYTLSGEFSAPKSVPKQILYALMSDLIGAKFPLNNSAISGCAIGSQEITERDMYRKNTLAFTVRSLAPSGATSSPQGTSNLFLANLPTLGASLPNSTGIAFVTNPYGGSSASQGSGVIAAPVVLYDACNSSQPPGWTSGSNTPGGGYYGTIPQSGGGGYVPTDNSNPEGGPGMISSDQQDAQWLEYVDRVRWVATNFIATMPSKSATADPVMFQTAAPIITVIQAGYAKKTAMDATQAPPPADPYYTDDDAMMIDSPWNETEVGQIIGAGPYFMYTTRWLYKMRLISNPSQGIAGPSDVGGANSPTFPIDPRYQQGNSPPEFDIADGLVVKPSQ